MEGREQPPALQELQELLGFVVERIQKQLQDEMQERQLVMGTTLSMLYLWRKEYIIWQETGSRSFYASNVRSETVRRIQVELYTAKEYTETLEKLLKVLEDNEVAFEDPVPDYDRETKRFRYIVECEVL